MVVVGGVHGQFAVVTNLDFTTVYSQTMNIVRAPIPLAIISITGMDV